MGIGFVLIVFAAMLLQKLKMKKLLIKKKCINECGHKVLLKRNAHGATPSKECGTCKSLGVEKSRLQFAESHKKSNKSKYGLVKGHD
jgi:hypothetical protein